MNLIEQAAKRLEELRRAGAEMPELPDAADGNSAPRTSHPRTPEALMRALGALADDPNAAARSGERSGPAESRTGDSPAPAVPKRQVEIDLNRLKQRGFVTPDAPESQIADEFRVIKRPIIRNAQAKLPARIRNGNLVMVTSALPGEGKTFTALNLAISIAMEYDNTVLLVDGDVAHPALPELLNLPPAPGLLDLLTHGTADVADALVKTNIEKLTVLPSGSRHRRATELLASEQMASLLGELATRYADRIIIFDSPPLLATTEARVLATHMGQVIMVVAADSTTRSAVNLALATVESCEIVLMMLNKASKTDVGSYYSYHDNEVAR